MTPSIHDLTLDYSNTKYIIGGKKYFIVSYIKILLEENSDAIITIYDLNNIKIATIDTNNKIFENKNYNKTLFLKPNKDVVIYIYHHLEENSRNFVNKRKDDVLILITSDCEKNQLKYCFDNGFENYVPLGLDLKQLNEIQKIIYSFNSNQSMIQKETFYTVYIKCESGIINNHSDIYENYTLNNGIILIEKNRKIYSNSQLQSYKTNLFYQYFECNSANLNYSEKNEFYASIDGNILEKLKNETSSFTKGENQTEFYFKTENECLFNFYQSEYNEDDYNKLAKYSNFHYDIIFISRNEIKIEIIPKYKNIDFDFYFFMYLDKTPNNSLSNKCYMRKLISDKDYFNPENITIKKIEFRNGTIFNNSLIVPHLNIGEFINSNILAKGKIFVDIEEYIFYQMKSHKIKESDFPEIIEENKGLSEWVIAGISLVAIALISLGVFLFYNFRKRNNLDVDISNEEKLSLPLDK